MALGRAKRSRPTNQRRTGPPGEVAWWDETDQAFVEQPLLSARAWGRGWQRVPMFNNEERFDPYGDDAHSDAVRTVRAARRLTALDEGAAWRHRRDGVLAVARLETFAAGDAAEHRATWQEHGTACLDAVWRARWRERDRTPGWIEARVKAAEDLDALDLTDDWRSLLEQVDWIVVEDHTGSTESASITSYEHLTIWCGRAVATLTIRHDQQLDLATTAVSAAVAAYRRLYQLDR